MTSIRVRLCIDRDPCLKTEQCWMLVDTSSCKYIHDFEYVIRKKFFMDGHNVILNLYLDDFLLPSQEKIEIIRDNDVIRVREDKASTLKEEKSLKLTNENKNENTKKRKFEDSKDSTKKSKKMKRSPTKDKNEQNFQLKNQTQSQAASTKTPLKTSNKTKCQKAMEFLQKASKDNTKRFSGGEASAGSSFSRGKKHQTKSLRKKFQSSALTCILEKLHSSSSNKQISAPKPGENIVLEKGSKKGIQFASKLPLSVQKGKRESNQRVKDVQNINGIPGCKGDPDSSKQTGMAVDVNRIQSSQKASTSTSSSSNSCGSSSDGESSTKLVKKSTFNGQAISGSNEPQEGLEPQTAISQDVGKQSEPHSLQKQSHDICLPKQTSSNHIRFDYDSEPVVERTAEKASLPFLNIAPSCSASSNNKAANGTPDLSPIQQNIEHTVPLDNAQKRPTSENKDLKGRCRINNFRKDVYTYKSVVMESTRMEKEPEEALCPVPADVPKKDFSQHQPLIGPPRVGETVAYKTLELSQSYTPEISQYKVGKVLSFDPASKSMKLKLTKESLTRVTGDGHISLKFELYDDEEEESSLPPVEIPDEVDVQWSEMIDPRLIVAPKPILK